MASINTNAAANQARQALAASQKELATSRTRIATGKAIGSAKDNGAIHSIATMMSAERSGWNVANDSLARGQSLIATASAGLDAINDLLQKAREKAVAYRDTSLSTQAKASIRADIEALLNQADRVAKLAEFDGKRPLADDVLSSPSTPSTPPISIETTWTSGTATLSADGWVFSGEGPAVAVAKCVPFPGQMTVPFTSHDNGTSVEIWQGGQRVAATGQPYAVGGGAVGPALPVGSSYSGQLRFNYDPANGTSVEVRIGGAATNKWEMYDPHYWPFLSSTPIPPPPSAPPAPAHYEFVRSSSGDLEGVAAQPMTLDALDLDTLDWNDPNSLLTSIDKALGKAVNAASYYGERASSFDRLVEQNGRLADALETGVGNLIDADLGRESAKLQAGQIKESLATKALAIANAAPQWILALFKS